MKEREQTFMTLANTHDPINFWNLNSLLEFYQTSFYSPNR